MIIVMQVGAPQAQIDAVADAIRELGHEPLVMPGEDRWAIGVPANLDSGQRSSLKSVVSRLEGVSQITETSRPYKLASAEWHREPTVVEVKGVRIGPGNFVVMGGPCSVESYEQYRKSADVVKATGSKILRGGAFKPRTSPYSFQGLQEEGLKIIQKVGEETGLVTISEVMTADMVGKVAEYVDILQIGARSMQNFPLLVEAGKSGKPVFLKRGPSATIDEFLLAAEYVLNEGNSDLILCERGILPHDRQYTRNTLDLAAVPVLKSVSHLPVIVDPSHGTGVAKYVAPMAKAAMVVGAHGVMIEMHPDPKTALSDGSQALDIEQYTKLVSEMKGLADYLGVKM